MALVDDKIRDPTKIRSKFYKSKKNASNACAVSQG